MVKFKKLIIEGFGSLVDETTFKLDRPGLNILIAKNGSGKTSLFSAFYWVLYGYTLKATKSVATWDHLQPKDYQGTKGTVKFLIGTTKYEVIRCADYKGKILNAKGANRLILLENGQPSQIRDKKEVQAEINRLVGYSAELFKNSIIFGQRLKRLIQETGPNKKKVFEEAFDASFLEDAKKKADKDYKAAADDYKEATKDLEHISDKLTMAKDERENLKSILARFEQKKQETIKEIEDELEEAMESRDQLLAKAKKKPKVEKELAHNQKRFLELLSIVPSDLEGQITNLKATLKTHDNRTMSIKARLAACKAALEKDTCDYCGQKIKDNKHQKKVTTQQLKELEDELKGETRATERVSAEIQALKGRLSSIKDSLDEVGSLKTKNNLLQKELNSLNNAENDIKHIGRRIKEYQAKLRTAHNLQPEVDLRGVTVKIEELRKKKLEIKAHVKALRIKAKNLEWLSKEALSNKGIKAYIFDTMLGHLNEALRYYEQFIGFRAEFKIDFASSNKDLYTVVYKGKDMIFYEDLSGGQAQLVDVVSAFAVHDIISHGKPCNLLVFDEVFEGLDEDNVDLVFELIQEKAQNKTLFLITHNLALQNSSNKIIRLSLNDKGHTVMKTLGA